MDVKKLFIETNRSADTTVVFIQGGLSKTILTDESIDLSTLNLERYYYSKACRYLKKWIVTKPNFVHVKQVQHINPSNNVKNIEDAKSLNKRNIEIMHQVINYHKDKEKKIIILGHSFGALLVQEYIAKYGSQDVEKVILANTRLFFPKFVPLSIMHMNITSHFNRKGHISKMNYFRDNKKDKLLFAQLMLQDYTLKWSDLKLDNVYYIIAKGDSITGSLSKIERDFIKQKQISLKEYSAFTSGFYKLFASKLIDSGRIAHHIIFTPIAFKYLKKLINKDVKKLKPSFMQKKQKKQLVKLEQVQKSDNWQNVGREIEKQIRILKRNKKKQFLSNEELDKIRAKIKELKSKR